jgi:hypothetical protein
MRHDDAADVTGRPPRGELTIDALEESLSRTSGDRVHVRSIREKEFGKSSSFAIRRIDVHLASGDVLPMVLKDLNPLRQLDHAKHIRRLELTRSRREVWMYRHILPGLALGTPRLYGYRWEPEQGNLWLLLEDMGPHRLRHRSDLALYERAAAWAGRFHQVTAGMPSDELLLSLDRPHYQQRCAHMEAMLDRVTAQDRPLVERALARCEEYTDLVEGLPRGMLHGEFFGNNVLVRADPAKTLAVIDWETAAIGPQYADLASITAGRWTTSERQAMRRAYFEARRSPATDWDRFNQQVDMVATLQAVNWLAFWLGSDPEHPKYARRVARWVGELGVVLGQDVTA